MERENVKFKWEGRCKNGLYVGDCQLRYVSEYINTAVHVVDNGDVRQRLWDADNGI